MKTRNFPEKQSIRRGKALEALLRIKDPDDKIKKQIETLKKRIDISARSRRTKKRRG